MYRRAEGLRNETQNVLLLGVAKPWLSAGDVPLYERTSCAIYECYYVVVARISRVYTRHAKDDVRPQP